MKTISVRDLRSKSAQIWRELQQEKDMVVTSKGRPVGVLSYASESNLERSLERDSLVACDAWGSPGSKSSWSETLEASVRQRKLNGGTADICIVARRTDCRSLLSSSSSNS